MDYKDPAFWSVVVALLALILSQLPPILVMLKGKKIELFVDDQFALSHFLGKINLYLYVDIENCGGRQVTISSIECFIEDDQHKRWNIPAQSFVYQPRDSQESRETKNFIIGRIHLKPGEYWQERLKLYREWSETEEEVASNVINGIKNSIQKQLPCDELVYAEEEEVSKALAFYRENFDLHKGNFKLYLVVNAEDGSILQAKGFEFILYESHIKLLQLLVEEYKTGFGIYLPHISDSFVWPRLRPTISDKTAKERYEFLQNIV